MALSHPFLVLDVMKPSKKIPKVEYDPKMSDVIILTHYYIVRINVKSYVFTYFDP
jgi:hypothetical protein